MSRYWYYYQGGNNGDGDQNPINYLIDIRSPNDLCVVGGSVICAIYSPPNGVDSTVPTTLSQNLLSYFTPVKNLSTGFPNKAYAYSKP